MKTSLGNLLLFGAVLLFVLGSCKTSIESLERYKYYYFTYNFPPGGIPSVEKDSRSASVFSGSEFPRIQLAEHRLKINIPRFLIRDGLGTYTVISDEAGSSPYDTNIVIRVEKLNKNTWEPDVEDTLSVIKSPDLDLVLVLDQSSSLGPELGTVRSSALQFIHETYLQIPNVRIALVCFTSHHDVMSTGLMRRNQERTLVDSLNYYLRKPRFDPSATSLYYASDVGLSLLRDSSSRETKVLVVFTDGKNNDQPNANYEDSRYLLANLRSVGEKVACYTIGLRGNGGIDGDELDLIAKTGNGSSYIIDDASSLESRFSLITSNVATFYTLSYSRNSSNVTLKNLFRARFHVSLNAK